MDRPIEKTVELTDQEYRNVLACVYLWLKLPVARDPASEEREEQFNALAVKLGEADGIALIYRKKNPRPCPVCEGSGMVREYEGQTFTCDTCGGEGITFT